MPRVEIDLNDGFNNDSVEITVNGTTAAQLQNVTTNLSSNLAGHAEQEVPPGKCRVEVLLGGQQIGRTEFPLDADKFVQVRKEDGHLHFEVKDERPAYF